jgi:hypothetical protein
MQRIQTDIKRFDILRAFDQFLVSAGLKLGDASGITKFLEQVSQSADEHQKNQILIHGLRVQNMFAFLAAAMNGCKIITEEDNGEFFTDTLTLKRPDFRILTKKSQEFFVEVKNFNQDDPLEPYPLKTDYAGKLEVYAREFEKPLLFAIFWRKWGIWTLNPLRCFTNDGQKYSLLLTDALRHDQMFLLGDVMIGITKDLKLRIITDPEFPRTPDKCGKFRFRIQKAALWIGGKEIIDKTEQKIGWFFFLHGAWTGMDQPCHIENNEVLWIDMVPTHEEAEHDNGFDMIGTLSRMIANQFNSVTVDDGVVTRLLPIVGPEKFGISIPDGFKSDVLGIWRFTMLPDQPVFPDKE